ncbi:ornithine aminotransferase [Physocladia obscura]|uniref:ornithine aminotransferase n=1 Tax=Physocladia obscura TaxID=109957 RepID=A0AAD5XLQ2_9FUNG|nr:ornithine aminotransferase [Physocladia obscura]
MFRYSSRTVTITRSVQLRRSFASASGFPHGGSRSIKTTTTSNAVAADTHKPTEATDLAFAARNGGGLAVSSQKAAPNPFAGPIPLLLGDDSATGLPAGELSSHEIIALEHKYGAHNYHPLEVVFSKAKGIYVTDPEGRTYMDFLSAYSAVNQGHAHPRILKVLVEQAATLSLSSRAFYNNKFGDYAKFITEFFGYEMVLPMNTGAEAVETAMKLARRWGYEKKGIPANEAIFLSCSDNFHGRTISIVSMSTDPSSRVGFGPFTECVGPVCPVSKNVLRYNNIDDLELALKAHGSRVCGFLVEPIQGEAGVVVPDEGYLTKAYELCKKYNVLFIADEIQSGLARTGKMLALDHENIKADILILGKALSGGVYPVSAVLSSKEVMLCIRPGEHGSTYGGNPLGAAIAVTALTVLRDEKMAENALAMGQIFRAELQKEVENSDSIVEKVRGKGLLNAIVINEGKIGGRKGAWEVCLLLKKYGLLAKPTHRNIIRLAPPLCITEPEVFRGVEIIKRALDDVKTLSIQEIHGGKVDHH